MNLLPELRAALIQAADERAHAALVAADGPAGINESDAPAHRPRHHRLALHGRRLWAAIGASGTAVTGGIIAAIVLLSAGTPAAYAGWAAVPSTASPAALASAISKCYKVGSQGDVLGQPVLSEARGESTAAVYVIGSTVYMCRYDSELSAITDDSMGPLGVAPGPDQLSVPYQVSGFGGSGKLPKKLVQELKRQPLSATILARDKFSIGDGYGYWALGRAGSDVSAVTFAFASHQNVTATVENGWYFAWWPWTTFPRSVTVTTVTGTTTSPMTASGTGLAVHPTSACTPGSTGCAFVKTPPVPTAASTTTTGSATSTTTPAEAQLAADIQSCDASTLASDTVPAEVFAQPVLNEVHGVFAAVVSVINNGVYACLTGGHHQGDEFYMQRVGSFGTVRTTPGPDQLSVPYAQNGGFGSGDPYGTGSPLGKRPSRLRIKTVQFRALRERLSGAGYGPYTFGQAGSNVSAVTFAFANGKTVAATVENGWYFAWWPWISNPTSVTVTTSTGSTTSPLTGTNDPRTPVAPGCQPGSNGCVFVNNPAAPTTTSTTTPTGTTPPAVTTTPAEARVATAVRACDADTPGSGAGLPAEVFAGRPVLTEVRGKSAAAVDVVDSNVYLCRYESAFSAVTDDSMGPLRKAPGPDQLSVPYEVAGLRGSGGLPPKLVQELKREPLSPAARLARMTFSLSDGYGYWALGRAGSDVSAITFAFAHHQTATATIENGWYFAWWPWTTYPTSVTVKTNTRRATSPMTASGSGLAVHPIPACRPGTTRCVFVKTPPTPTTTR